MKKENNRTIYVIRNKNNGKCYVGSCSCYYSRKSRHKQNFLKKQYGQYNKLYPAIYKEGLDSFEFKILEKCYKKKAKERESFWIEKLKSFSEGYNCTKNGRGGISFWKGKKRDKNTKEKISISLTGKKQSEETKKKRSVALKKARLKYKDKWLKKERHNVKYRKS